MKRRRILMVAGEASGDALGARLAAELLALDPSLDLYGAGGAAMREAGVRTIVDTAELSVMGFAELGRELGRVLKSFGLLRRELRDEKPELFVPIDFPDFNLPLCRTAKKAGTPVFYYVSPQVWAWRRGRIDTIARNVTRIVVLFPFEEEIYRSRGVDAHFVGHPLAESVAQTRPRGEIRRELGISEDARVVALLPGSRRKEVEAMLPAMLAAVERIRGQSPAGTVPIVPVIAEAGALAPGLVQRVGGEGVACRRGDTYNLLAASDAALVTSGTATLESALVGCPMVVAYRMSAFSYTLARRLVKVPYIAMPNLLAGREVVCELVQDEADPLRMAEELSKILNDGARRAQMLADFDEIRRLIRRPGSARRAAELAMELLH